MSASSTNPIVERVTRRWRVPSPRAANWIGLAVALAGASLTLASLLDSSLGFWVALWSALITLPTALLMLLSPLMGLSTAARLTARYASAEEYALLRITHLTPDAIFDGYAEIARTEMRIGLAISRWAVLAVLPVLALMLGTAVTRGSCDTPLSCLAAGLIPALAAGAAVAGCATLLTRAGVTTGVWLALRWPSWAGVLAGLAVMVGLMICGVEALLPVLLLPGSTSDHTTLFLAILAAVLGGGLLLAHLARADALRVIGRADPSVRAGL